MRVRIKLLAVGLIAILSGCEDEQYGKPAGAPSEDAASSDPTSGDPTSGDSAPPGSSSAPSSRGDNDAAKAAIASKVAFPEGYPKEWAVYSNGTPIEYKDLGHGGSSLLQLSRDQPQQIIDHFTKLLTDQGWEDPVLREGRGRHGKMLTLHATKAAKSALIISYTLGAHASGKSAQHRAVCGDTEVGLLIYNEPKLPDDIPRYPQARFYSTYVQTHRGRSTRVISYRTKADVRATFDLYQTELGKKGWGNLEGQQASAQLMSLFGTKDGRQASVEFRRGPELNQSLAEGDLQITIKIAP